VVDSSKKPVTFNDFQVMFERIYPHSTRTLEHAGVHLAEELGELSEAMLAYRGRHEDVDFDNLIKEAADFLSCIIGVFNSMEVNIADELSIMFSDNCHVCHKMPCEFSFQSVMDFTS